jgi:hypothetical protein
MLWLIRPSATASRRAGASGRVGPGDSARRPPFLDDLAGAGVDSGPGTGMGPTPFVPARREAWPTGADVRGLTADGPRDAFTPRVRRGS